MIYEATSFECSRIAQDLQIRKVQVESVVQLLNEGNAVPFIARYRKEKTGGLDEEALRQIHSRLNSLKQLNERKQTILKSIENQGRLADDLRREILTAPTVRRLEDLYLPFKPRKKALANAARDKGLEPLALAIWHSDPAVGNLDELLPTLVDPEKQLNSPEDVKLGVQHLIAEMINETAEVRGVVRRVLWKSSTLTASKNEKVPEGQGNEHKAYFQFKEPTQDIRPHRILALNRGEKDGVLKVKLEWPADAVTQAAATALAEHLLQMAGTPIPQPRQPARPVAPTVPNDPHGTPSIPGDPPGMPVEPAPMPPGEPPPMPSEPAPEPPSPPPEVPGALPNEAPPEETPPGAVPPTEIPVPDAPAEAPAVAESPTPIAPSNPAPPHAAPLVESLTTERTPVLTGDPLVEAAAFRSPHVAFLKACLDDALGRLLLPNLEREIRSELTEEAEIHAIKVVAHTVRGLLMQPPLVGKRVLAIDPGFRNGCKLAALDESGALLEHAILYPHGGPGGPRKKEKKPKDPPPAAVTSAEASTPAPASEVPTGEAPTAEAPAAPSMETPVPSTEMASGTTPTPEMAPLITDGVPVPAPENTPAPAEPPVDKRAEAKSAIVEMVKKHQINVIALGNGAACRDTEEIVADVVAGIPDLAYVIVPEAGASVYSVSPSAKEEFPTLDAAIRGAISIGRRLQDPLGEFVKIDAPSLAASLYPHDPGRKELKETLEGVVESCVNQVGVDVNTGNVPLLRHIAGLNPLVARDIVEHRKAHGPFASREQLLGVPSMTPARFAQSAGFLKVPGGANPLDRTWVHPESYGVAERVFAELGFTSRVLDDKVAHGEFRRKLNEANLEELAAKLEVSVPALDDMFFALARPGKDPRDEMPAPILKKGILKLEDLQPGQELKGTVLNVVDFGAFVDVGLKDSGLVHISQMANKYIKSPYDVVSVNDIVTVWILKIDKDSNHVSLTMIKPGSERRPGDRDVRPARREGESQDRGPRPSAPPRGRSGPPREGGPRPGGRPPQSRDRRPPREQPKEAAAPPPPAPPPPRKPKRETPKPKLTQAAMEGKAPLRTLSELAAFFAAKEVKEKPAPPAEEKTDKAPEPPGAEGQAT